MEKLNEARFFLSLMEKAVENDGFVYFLSAFLSALSSATEPIKLQPLNPIDAPYKDWKKKMDDGPLKDRTLLLLREMRNGEVHKAPTGKLQSVGASFPEGLDLSSGGYVEIDFSGGKPVGRHKAGADASVETHPLTVSWHFDAPGNPDVLATCRAGLAVVEQVISSRSAMQFDREETRRLGANRKSQKAIGGAKANMDRIELTNESGFGNRISLPGKLEPNPGINHGAQPLTLKSFSVAGGLNTSSSKGSVGVHIRLHLAELPDLFIMLDLEARDARNFAAALAREAAKVGRGSV